MRVTRNAPTIIATSLLSLMTLLFSAAVAAGAGKASFNGTLMVPKDAELTEGSTAKLMLVEVSGDYDDPTPIATQDLGSISSGAVPYELAVDRSRLDDGNQYALRVQVMDGAGNVTWTNGNIWPVEPMANPVTSYLQLQPAGKSA